MVGRFRIVMTFVEHGLYNDAIGLRECHSISIMCRDEVIHGLILIDPSLCNIIYTIDFYLSNLKSLSFKFFLLILYLFPIDACLPQ